MDDMQPSPTARAIVPVLACVLTQLCARNDEIGGNTIVTKFHALRPPPISIEDYLTRISKYAACSGECFVLALIYVDRIIKSNPNFVVNSLNIHRLLITSIMLAAKFFDDHYYNNAYYAKVGGVPSLELNSLEVEFLFMTNFTLWVSTQDYSQYYTELLNHAMNSSCGCCTEPVPELVIEGLRPYVPREMRQAHAKAALDAAAALQNGGHTNPAGAKWAGSRDSAADTRMSAAPVGDGDRMSIVQADAASPPPAQRTYRDYSSGNSSPDPSPANKRVAHAAGAGVSTRGRAR